MPDIASPLVATPFVSGEALDPDRVADNLYVPQTTPTTMSVINGYLTEPNLATPYTISYDLVRPGAHADGKAVGQTANLDFFKDWYGGDWDGTSRSEMAGVGQTGVGIKFYVPYDNCKVVKLRWHVGIIVDAGVVRDNTGATVVQNPDGTYSTPGTSTYAAWRENTVALLSLFIDGQEQTSMNRGIGISDRAVLGGVYYTGAGVKKPLPISGSYDEKLWNEPVRAEHRWWSGHFNIDSTLGLGTGSRALDKGWHTASIRVTPPKWTTTGVTLSDGNPYQFLAPHIRLKTCNFNAISLG